jgi:hypothetical protein
LRCDATDIHSDLLVMAYLSIKEEKPGR